MNQRIGTLQPKEVRFYVSTTASQYTKSLVEHVDRYSRDTSTQQFSIGEPFCDATERNP